MLTGPPPKFHGTRDILENEAPWPASITERLATYNLPPPVYESCLPFPAGPTPPYTPSNFTIDS
jgi:hypothetical protein